MRCLSCAWSQLDAPCLRDLVVCGMSNSDRRSLQKVEADVMITVSQVMSSLYGSGFD